MATMNISLPDKMKKWVERQVRSGRYANASDYIRDLIRDEQDEAIEREAALSDLNALIEEGLASGISERSVEDIRRDVKAELGLLDESDAA